MYFQLLWFFLHETVDMRKKQKSENYSFLCSDWLLSGALARMLFATSEDNGDCSSLTTTGMQSCYL